MITKKTKISNENDYGTLHIANKIMEDISFSACGLSLGARERSEFHSCSFSNINIKKCTVGFPIFSKCHFRNIASNRDGVLIYGAAFKECIFSGWLKNVVIGFSSDFIAIEPNNNADTKRLQAENIEIASSGPFAIDVTEADLEFVSFRGETIIPYVKCAPNQAFILKADNLFERLIHLGRSEKNRAKSNFFLGTGVMPGCQAGIAIFNKEVRENISELENALRREGIMVIHY